MVNERVRQQYLPILRTIGAGILIGVGLLSPWLWIATLLGVAVHLYDLHQRSSVLRTTFAAGTTWLTASLISIGWFWSTIPITWLPIESLYIQILLVLIYWLTAALYLAAGGALFGLLFAVGTYLPLHRVVLLGSLPFLWVLSEIFGSLVFSIFTQGAASGVSIHFSFGYVGYALAQHGLFLELARVFGVYGLSWTLVALATIVILPYTTYKPEPLLTKKISVGVLLVILITTPLSLPERSNPDAEPITVAVVTSRFDGSYRHDFTTRQTQLLTGIESLTERSLDYIVLPEDSRLFSTHQNYLLPQLQLRSLLGESVLIDSGRKETTAGTVLRGYVYTAATNQLHRTDKQYLVPQGEYMPTLYTGVLKRFIAERTLTDITRNISYVPGALDKQDFPEHSPIILFCFESVSPIGVRNIVNTTQHNIPFVAHPTSHAWFNNPDTLWHQLDTMLRIQARWNNLPIVNAANMAPSKVYLPNGTIINTADMETAYHSLTVDIHLLQITP